MQLELFQTPTEWAALALVLVAGLAFGLALHPGGRKWRERFRDIESDFAGYHAKAEEDLRVASRRIGELEADNARLVRDAQAATVAPPAAVAAPAAAVAAAAPEPVVTPAPVAVADPAPAEPVAEERHAAYVQERDKDDRKHSIEAGLAGAVLGAVADRVADMRDGHQDHGILHNLGAGALGAIAGVVGEKIVDKIGDHASDKREAEREAEGH